MKRKNIAALMIIASLAVNGIGFMNMTVPEVSAETTDETFSPEALGIRGDVNNDGVLSVSDLLRYRNYLLGKDISLSSNYQADINGDGKINIVDFSLLKGAFLNEYIIWSAYNMPVMDGSTSAIPLEAGFKAKMLGINYADARTLVKHHKTHESFQMLLSGENDMIFTVPISESQKKDAEEAGVHLNLEPVAREGFVFVVNKNNPVDSLTQEQIRDIYSGKITNWKEVGGNDEKIVPYQRNQDSGSQNYMADFMDGYSLMDPPKEYTIASMGALMDSIAIYDNSTAAIGYSVYSYAAQMYENSADVKFISVDGVMPSRETMADDTYPLLSSTYIMYTDNASQNTLDFVKWATSEEGQNCVLENGYVPVMNIEYPDRLKLYRAVGTGCEKPADYKPSRLISSFTYQTRDFKGNEYIPLNLVDVKFEEKINDDIKKVTAGMNKDDLFIMIKAVNGYMTVKIQSDFRKYYEFRYGMDSVYNNCVLLNYDLINSRRIEKFSDLFYKNADFVQMVNDSISEYINGMASECIKTDFLGITGDIKQFSIDSLILSDDNPYLTDSFLLPYTRIHWIADQMVTGNYFDMKKLFNKSARVHEYPERSEWIYDIIKDENGEIRQIPSESAFHTAEELAEHKRITDKIFEKALEIRNNLPYEEKGKVIIHFPEMAYYSTSLNVVNINYGKNDGGYNRYMFDPETGDQIFMSDIFGKDFERYDDCIEHAPIVNFEECTLSVTVRTGNDSEYVTLSFDPEKINKKYISVPEPAKSVPLEHELKGRYMWQGETGYGYKSSYVLEHGPISKQWPIEGDWNITAKNECWSYGKWWYECWDSDDVDYYGWISEDELYLNVRGEK